MLYTQFLNVFFIVLLLVKRSSYKLNKRFTEEINVHKISELAKQKKNKK